MSDSNVQQQWLNAAADLQKLSQEQREQGIALGQQARELFAANRTIDTQINQLQAKLASVARIASSNPREYLAQRTELEKQYADLLSQQRANLDKAGKLINEGTSLINQSNKNKEDAKKAEEKAKTASEGPPNTQTTTPPVETVEVKLPETQYTNQDGVVVTPIVSAAAINSDASTRLSPDSSPDLEGFSTTVDEFGNTVTIDSSGQVVSISQPPPVSDPEAVRQAEIRNATLQAEGVSAEASAAAESAAPARGLQAQQRATQAQATLQDVVNFNTQKDWRLRLSLAPSAKYLYNATNPGILGPLATTRGVLFPYTPQVNMSYTATYDSTALPHTNFLYYNYKNSSLGAISINAEFTAQDTFEANYLLAVMHFFRSVTKMFYGKDNNPKLGTPPPLCYLNGFGPYQFNNHAVVVSEYSFTLPKDVDYIRAGNPNYPAGVRQDVTPKNVNPNKSNDRRQNGNSNVGPGGEVPFPKWTTVNGGTVDPTYVPTKIVLNIVCLPIVTRGDIVNNFSLEKYATGELLLGSTRKGGGIW